MSLNQSAIFWDLENCPPSRGADPVSIISALRDRFLPRTGPIKQINGYAALSRIPEHLKASLQSSGCHLIDVPIQRKDAADKMIISDLVMFAVDHPIQSDSTFTIILISGDQDFAYPLAKLRLRGYQIILIVPPGGAAETLKRQGDTVCEWTEFSVPQTLAEQASEEAQASIAFEPLLLATKYIQDQGIERPLFSQIGKILHQFTPNWRQENIQNLSDYITLAVEGGLVKTGGIAPQFWVQLERQTPYEGMDFTNIKDRFQPLLDVLEQADDKGINEPELAWIGSQLRFIFPDWRELTGHYRLVSYIEEAQNHGFVQIRQDGLQHYVSLPLFAIFGGQRSETTGSALKSDIELLHEAWASLRKDEILPTERTLIGRMRELRPGWFLQTSSFRSIRGLIKQGEQELKIIRVEGVAPQRMLQPIDNPIEGYNPESPISVGDYQGLTEEDYNLFIQELNLFSIFSAKGRYKMATLLQKQLPALRDHFSLGKLLIIIQMALARGSLTYSNGEILWEKKETAFRKIPKNGIVN
ncbi:MAG: NYN domain-containing protein [Candidatus Hodarchaeales archaeon]|jgi:hypothetical protein